jgi:hypothetical protein
VLRSVPFADIIAACRRIGPAALLPVGCALGWHAFNTSAFKVLLAQPVRWIDLYKNRIIGDGYNNLLPLLGLGGEPWKLRHLSHWVPPQRVAAALLQDRVIESSFGMLFTGGCLALTIHRYPLHPALRTGLWIFVGLTWAIALGAAWLVLSSLPGKVGALVSRIVGVPADGSLERASPTRFLRVIGWHTPARVLGLVEVGCVFWALGMPVDPLQVAFVDSVLNAASFVAFMVPQGMGVTELTAVNLFTMLGWPPASAIAFALTRRGRLLVVSLLGVTWHVVTLARGARGRPQATERWDEQYRTGHWRYLDGAREAAHYEALVEQVRRAPRARHVLDVGCGHGRLYRLLRESEPEGMVRYVGLDVSREAIDQAKANAGADASFEVASFEDHVPQGPFDVVIFNESIYYARDPVAVLERYAAILSDEGQLIVSIRDLRKNHGIRAAIRAAFSVVASQPVLNEHKERWDVDVLRPRA